MTRPDNIRRTANVKRAEERYGPLCWRSVSDVLGVMAKPALLPWAVRLTQAGLNHQEESKRAMSIGSATHDLIEQMLLEVVSAESNNPAD